MDMKLSGKTALITGAGAGIGRGIAKALASEGVRLFCIARNEAGLVSLANEIVEAGNHEPVWRACDLTKVDIAGEVVAGALKALGSIDILVNNAGGSIGVGWDTPDEDWAAGMTLNFDIHRRITQALLPQMISRNFGRIINVTGSIELKQVNIAACAKAALTVWSKALAHQIGEHGITSNCIEPGLINSNQFASAPPALMKELSSSTAFKAFGEPEDIAAAAVFLASEHAAYITGTTLIVDGGLRQRSF